MTIEVVVSVQLNISSEIYCMSFFFFFNDTATTEIYTLSLHDALPIWLASKHSGWGRYLHNCAHRAAAGASTTATTQGDRKSTRLNSSHANISYAVFCLKKKKYSLKTSILHHLQCTYSRVL